MCKEGRACYDNQWIGCHGDGGWAEFVAVHKSLVSPIPDSVPLEVAALSEPMCGVESIFKDIGNPPKDARILIIGAAGVGILTAILLYHRGYRSVTISQRSLKRREIAKNLGFGYTVFSPDELKESFRGKNVVTEGFNLVIDTSGNPEAISIALDMMARRGKMAMYGGCSIDSKVALSGFNIFIRELTIMGVFIQPNCMNQAIKSITEMASNLLTVKNLGAKVYALEDFQKGIDGMLNAEITKAIFRIHNS